MYRAESVLGVIMGWLKQNQRELEVGNYYKITLEIFIATETKTPVKLRSIVHHESDLRALG